MPETLFQFVEKDENLFPEEVQVEQFTTEVDNLAFRLYIEIISNDRHSKAADTRKLSRRTTVRR